MSERVGRLAVNAVEHACLNGGWFFREQPITDQGIDAHIEPVDEPNRALRGEELGTGRLIALQIKGGKSQFRRPSPGGWWFQFDAAKAKYWLGHALPVVVLLVDLDTNEIYWQRVSAGTAISTGKHYKLEVPRHQTITTAEAEWRELASGLEQRAVSRFEFSLRVLPPAVRRMLESLELPKQADGALLAMHLSEGRSNPEGTVSSLLAASPVWLTRSARWSWRSLAAYASAHELPRLATESFVRSAAASDEDAPRSRDLANAAAMTHGCGFACGAELLAEAEALQKPDAVHVAVARTLLSQAPNDSTPWRLDPLLVDDEQGVGQSVAAQRLLAMQAVRLADLDLAISRGRAALALDEASDESQAQLARVLLTRWTRFGATPADLQEAVSLLSDVLEQRRTWSGPMKEPLEYLAQAYILSGDFEKLIRHTLPPPDGVAEQGDLSPRSIRMAAFAAAAMDRRQAVSAACAMLSNEPIDQLVRMAVGELELGREAASELRRQALQTAIVEDRFVDVAQLSVHLAMDGIDVRSELEELARRQVLPASHLVLVAGLLKASEDLDSAIPDLREAAKTDPAAADFLIDLLREAGRHVEASDAALSTFQLTGAEEYLVRRANCLIDHGDVAVAAEAARDVVAKATGRPVERARLLTFLAGVAADVGDWTSAERYLVQVLGLFDRPGDKAVWRLVAAQVNQGRHKRAAATVARHQPSVRSRDEAELWFRAHATQRWNERIALDAFALAERFPDDPQLSAALLSHIVMSTNGVGSAPDDAGAGGTGSEALDELDDADLDARRRLAQDSVPGELHREAFKLMELIVDSHGEQSGLRVITGADTHDLVEQMTKALKSASRADTQLVDLVQAVRSSHAPIGLLAGVLNRCYATLLVQRAMGVLVGSAADDAEHAAEVASARDHFDGSAVVDAAAVVTLAGIRDSGRLTRHFLSLVTPPAAMFGLHRAAFDVRSLAGSPGSMHWDSNRAGIVVTNLDGDEFRRIHRRSEIVQSYSDRIEVGATTDRTVLTELAGAREHAEWVDVLQLAKDRRLPLWSDDLGLRRTARSLGLSAFGTPAVVDAVRDVAVERATGPSIDEVIDWAFDVQLELAADMIVDLPLAEDDLIRLAEADGWRARAAAAALARPAWWAANPTGFAAVRRIYREARSAAPGDLVGWQWAAMYGAARALQPEAASAVLATLGMIGFDGDDPSDSERIAGMVAARRVAADLGHPDPAGAVSAVAAALAKDGRCTDPSALAYRVLDALGREPSSNSP